MKSFDQLPKNNGVLTLEQVADLKGIPVSATDILPGRVYSLKVLPPAETITADIVAQITGKDYLDLMPTGFVFFHPKWIENRTIIMLNLRAIPQRIADKILEIFYRFSSANGMSRLFDQDGNLLPLTQRRTLDLPFYHITPTQLSQLVGATNLNYAINKYSIGEIANARLIDWDQYGSLVKPKLSLKGLYPTPIDIETIYNRFIQNSQ